LLCAPLAYLAKLSYALYVIHGGLTSTWLGSGDTLVKYLKRPLLLAEVYPAGEAPVVAADSRALARALRVAGKVDPVFVDEIGDMPQAIVEQVRDGDVVIAMGAGSIGNVPGQLVDLLSRKGAAA
jgi:hypothetical protein